MQGRVYTAEVNAITITNAGGATDIWEVNCPADAVLAILSVRISQYSDVGDAASEILPYILSRGGGTAGSGGDVIVPRPHQLGTVAFGGTVESNNTTQSGTPVEILSDSFNIRSGLLYQPPEKEIIWVSPSGIFLVELPVAPADDVTAQASITFEVFGG